MEKKSFVLISRQILNLAVWSDPYDCTLFFYCLFRASHNYFLSLEPGQLYFSVQSLSESLGWSRNSVTKHLRKLEDNGMISICHKNEGSVLTILWWKDLCGERAAREASQGAGLDDQNLCVDAQKMKLDVQKLSMACAPFEHYQKDNQKDPRIISQREREFNEWWSRYPKHARKSEALRAWMNMRDVPAALLTAALERAKQTPGWMENNGRYIPSAVTWLDGEWEDYIERESEDSTAWTEY